MSVTQPRRPRVLFVSEAITLAQVVRLVTLASGLDPRRYEVAFASAPFDPIAFAGTHLEPIPLVTIDRNQALKKLERGERIYEKDVLAKYVEAELELFERVEPDLVIGDFRLSLAVSAAHAGIPHAALINAYFSPFAERDGFPVPDHPIVSLIGSKLAAEYFPRAVPIVFAHFVAPLDAVRKRYGLPASGGLLDALSAGDFTLYPDVPELCPTRDLPPGHRYLGHVPWEPSVKLPAELADLAEPGRKRPFVYVTLGSSGRLSALESVLAVLGELDVDVLVATAGRFELERRPANVRVERFVPGSLMARRAAFVVTNGGASTSYQALAEGTPVLGVPSNLDQYLAMTAIEKASAGRLVRAGEATPAAIRSAVHELFTSRALKAGALAVGRAFARTDCHARFEEVLNAVFAPQKELSA